MSYEYENTRRACIGDEVMREAIRFRIAKIAWAVYLWAMGITEAELLADLYEEAAREYKSDRDNAWLMN